MNKREDAATCPTCGLTYGVTVYEDPDPAYIEGRQYCPICASLVRGPQ